VTAQSKTAGVSPKISSNGNGNAQQASGNPPKATVQSTLFGSIATKKLEPKKAQKKKDVEKEASSPVPRQTHLLSSTQAAWACVAKDTPFDVLWANTQSKLNEIFKIKYMRYLQPAAVECALKRQSQLIIMATGGGKSLCYQLPAIVLGGTTIVVSPLIALMADQSQALLNKGISTAVISSANGERRNLDVMERMLGRSLRAKTKSDQDLRKPVTLVYCTPEQIQTVRFRNILTELHQKNRLALFAIDEAHCCSTWFQFRPAYAKLGWLRDNFPDVPVMACTATATPRVIQDIQATLRLENCPCRVGSFDRPNIRYSVRYKDDLDQVGRGAKGDLLDYLQRVHQKALKKSTRYSGIIYVHTRKDTNDLAAEITKKTGIVASAYHGGLAVANRDQVQKLWTSGKIQIAVATIAFGMGIDVAHVRYVIHWSLSKSMEAFYQESGRAGRDGLPSSSVLYYSKDDGTSVSCLYTDCLLLVFWILTLLYLLQPASSPILSIK
jgi:RecQ family ATP-dependent DNA helicase